MFGAKGLIRAKMQCSGTKDKMAALRQPFILKKSETIPGLS